MSLLIVLASLVALASFAIAAYYGYVLLIKYGINSFILKERLHQIKQFKSRAADLILKLDCNNPSLISVYVEYADWWCNLDDYTHQVTTHSIWQTLVIDLDTIDNRFGNPNALLTGIDMRSRHLYSPPSFPKIEGRTQFSYPESLKNPLKSKALANKLDHDRKIREMREFMKRCDNKAN